MSNTGKNNFDPCIYLLEKPMTIYGVEYLFITNFYRKGQVISNFQ